MADFTLSKSLFSGKYRNASSTPGNIAYALFVLFCFWAGAQLLNLLVHAPGVYERLMQVQETGRPRVEIGLGVGTIFGLIPFLVGCLIFRLAGLSLGLAQEEYEEANDEQGRQNNRCDFRGFLVVDCRGDHFDCNF